jgi:hypothetical protein
VFPSLGWNQRRRKIRKQNESAKGLEESKLEAENEELNGIKKDQVC